MQCNTTGSRLGAQGTKLSSLVRTYLKDHRPTAHRERDFFVSMPSLELAIHHAAFAIDERDKRYSHQRRIRMRPMREAHTLLLSSMVRLRALTSFDDLHTFLATAFAKIHGLGALYTYDTALRIGFFLGLEPTVVYLHAGTRVGARALKIKSSHTVSVKALPRELQTLPPHEIENFLCIFKPKAAP